MHRMGENIVFVVGCPRSGTTWVQKILAADKLFITSQESHLFTSFIGPVMKHYQFQLENPSGRGGTGLPCYFTQDEFLGLMRDVFYKAIGNVRDYDANKIFVEKTPSHALVIDKIHMVLPEARLIHVVRDPRDVVSSLLAASRSWGAVWAPKDIFRASIMWKRHVTNAEKAFVALPSDIKMRIHFEDLKKKTHQIIIQMFSFLGYSVTEREAEDIIERSRAVALKKQGEFARLTGEIVKEPSGFIRKGESGNWQKDIGRIRGYLIFLLLFKEMKQYGYSLTGSS